MKRLGVSVAVGVLLVVGAVRQSGAQQRRLLAGGSHATIAATTDTYCGVGRPGINNTEATVAAPSPALAGNVSTMNCFVGVAPGAGITWTMTLRVNEQNTALTCTVSGTATTCSDLLNQVPTVPGQRMSIHMVASA